MNDFPKLAAALTGRYRLERQLGRDGMATVYLAQDVRHDRGVARLRMDPEWTPLKDNPGFQRLTAGS